MIRRILLVWLIANFLIVGLVSWAAGSWYLSWGAIPAVLAESGLIHLPNLALPVLLLKFYWPKPLAGMWAALGWTWNGWRVPLSGIVAFAVAYALVKLITRFLGAGIPYQLPGSSAPIGPVHDLPSIFGLLLFLIGLVGLTLAGEETLFRGLVQTRISTRYGPWLGLILAVLLFGLRHLPADLFYGQAWAATPRMWLSRELQLYSFALTLGLARWWGRSTWASAIAHALMYGSNLFGF